jgi:hypothetical protein
MGSSWLDQVEASIVVEARNINTRGEARLPSVRMYYA